jgi:hypothetical protein
MPNFTMLRSYMASRRQATFAPRPASRGAAIVAMIEGAMMKMTMIMAAP